ncbi:MAG: OsmC family peroxiredoxin [Betaproteobacteria bacterium]|nr:OsmC family peroxiredoxin [Betaproteobacteria bacterium]NCA16732.1 OsmC family peroxiredoxin [Betaproteobacteria bacterium]NDF03781.1 OsmC family peroxiredoxin [Betaproteobacteria bacterium]
MDCTIRWTGPDTMGFVAETGSGHSFVMDGAPEGGGRDLAPRPMEVVLSGSAACTAYDVVLILRKSGQDLRSCEVLASAERAETDPKVFTKIHLTFRLRGRGLKESLVERAITLSHEKYCSATKMLGLSAVITHSHELIED